MKIKQPPGVVRVITRPTPAGSNIPTAGIHAVHVVEYDARIKHGTPEFAAINDYAGSLTRPTEAFTLTPVPVS